MRWIVIFLLLSTAVAKENFFFPVSKQHTTGIFTHPGLSITISKGGAADSSDNETPPPTTGGSTPATKTTTVGGGQEPDQGGGVRIVMESGRPTVVGPDGRRVVVPPGQVVYIRPPSGSNGSPGITSPEQPEGPNAPGSPDRIVTVWNPDEPGTGGQPDTPVVIGLDGIPLLLNPSQPELEVAWPSDGAPPLIIIPPSQGGRNRVPRQANLDCSDIAGTYSWSCTCGGRCKSTDAAGWTRWGWYPVRAVISGDCSVQLTMALCVPDRPATTGPAQVWGTGTSRRIVFPSEAICPPGLLCNGISFVGLPDHSVEMTAHGLSCDVRCQPSSRLPQARDIPPVRPRGRTGSQPPKPPPPGPQPPPPPKEPSGNFQDTILKAHNDARTRHSAKPLTWDPELAKGAQASADRCAEHKNMNDGIGENLHGVIADWTPAQAAQNAVDGWMKEQPNFSPATPEQCVGGECHHFTQVVWKSAERLGCGINLKCAAPGSPKGVACWYAGGRDPGNMPKRFADNVQA